MKKTYFKFTYTITHNINKKNTFKIKRPNEFHKRNPTVKL